MSKFKPKFKEFVQLAQFFYRTICIQPYSTQELEKNKVKNVQRSSWQSPSTWLFYLQIINLNLMVLAEIVYVILSFAQGIHIVEAIMCMSYIGFVAVAEFKMICVWWKRKALTSFMRELYQLFPATVQEQAACRMSEYLRQCKMVTITFSLLYMLLIWTYNLFAIMEYLIYDHWLEIRHVEKVLPYTMHIPWNWHDNWSYYFLYAMHCVAGYTSAAGHISSDLLLSATATHLVMHYDHIARRLDSYETQAISETGIYQWTGSKCDMEFVKSIIVYHNKILRLSDIMNDIFGIPLLLNFLISSFVICFVGFQMTINASVDVLFKLFLFLFSSMAQVYLICHYGQLLNDSSTNVANAVYNHSWYNADIRYKKMLVLIAKRAQRPASLKATFFVIITRGTMTEIMQISYKFFALLRTMFTRSN